MAKWNEVLRIEEALGGKARFVGGSVLGRSGADRAGAAEFWADSDRGDPELDVTAGAGWAQTRGKPRSGPGPHGNAVDAHGTAVISGYLLLTRYI